MKQIRDEEAKKKQQMEKEQAEFMNFMKMSITDFKGQQELPVAVPAIVNQEVEGSNLVDRVQIEQPIIGIKR